MMKSTNRQRLYAWMAQKTKARGFIALVLTAIVALEITTYLVTQFVRLTD